MAIASRIHNTRSWYLRVQRDPRDPLLRLQQEHQGRNRKEEEARTSTAPR